MASSGTDLDSGELKDNVPAKRLKTSDSSLENDVGITSVSVALICLQLDPCRGRKIAAQPVDFLARPVFSQNFLYRKRVAIFKKRVWAGQNYAARPSPLNFRPGTAWPGPARFV